MLRLLRFIALVLCVSSFGTAHVGSPDVYLDGNAGPYKLFITIRPPLAIPGVAEILVRSQSPGVTKMQAVPLPMYGSGAEHAPVPDVLVRSGADAQFFTGALWLMLDGSWQIRISVDGAEGAGTISIPVPAIARTTTTMHWPVGSVLALLGSILVAGLTAISGATMREAMLAGGIAPSERDRRKGLMTMLFAFCLIVLMLFGGKLWWNREARIYQERIYKPLNMAAQLTGGSHLQLNLSEPGWMQPEPGLLIGRLTEVLFVRKIDDLVLDHNHLMHLYAIREPALDVIYHLHPDQVQPTEFRVVLPAMPVGDYKLYADIVHENGLAETLTSQLHLADCIPTESARPLAGDDARAETTAVNHGTLGDTFVLPDGYRMRWLHANVPLRVSEGSLFQFELSTPAGGRPQDMALYMGMLGHAAFVKTDGTVFAHIHPNGTVSMSAFMLAQGQGNMAGMDHSQMMMAGVSMPAADGIPNRVAFPYGLPAAGAYRIFVQMKHGSTIETAAFDAVAH